MPTTLSPATVLGRVKKPSAGQEGLANWQRKPRCLLTTGRPPQEVALPNPPPSDAIALDVLLWPELSPPRPAFLSAPPPPLPLCDARLGLCPITALNPNSWALRCGDAEVSLVGVP